MGRSPSHKLADLVMIPPVLASRPRSVSVKETATTMVIQASVLFH